MKPKTKPIPKDQRKSSRERVFSTNFPDNIAAHDGKCFAPWEDYMLLKRKYQKLFERYKRETKRKVTS